MHSKLIILAQLDKSTEKWNQIDLFDGVTRDDIGKELKKRAVKWKAIKIIKDIYKNSEIVRIINNKESKQFKAKIGYKQGWSLNPFTL